MNNARKVVFVADGAELILPVTPQSVSNAWGINVETLNIQELGDVKVAGKTTLPTVKLTALLPNNRYSFASGSDAYGIISRLHTWCTEQQVVRYIVTGTDINVPVLIQSVEYAETDGSNDVTANITLVQYRYVKAAKIVDTTAPKRAKENPPTTPNTYTVQKGDTLWSIARKFYGDGSLCYKLATANGIKNPNLIREGDVITLPDIKDLQGYKETRAPSNSGKAAPKVTVRGVSSGQIVRLHTNVNEVM